MTDNRVPTYKTYVDWYGHGGLASGLSNWHYDASDEPAVLELSQAQHLRDRQSIHVVGGPLSRPFKGISGVPLEVSVWVYVPDVMLSPTITMQICTPSGTLVSDGASSTVEGEWQKLTLDTGGSEEEELIILLESTSDTHSWYLGWSEVRSPIDDVTCDVLSTRQVPELVYGRDAAQDLAETRTGEVSLSLRNEDGRYTPGESSSPLVEELYPNRQVLITAELDGRVYTLYVGYIQDFQIHAKLSERMVSISCYDLFGKLATTDVHVDLYPSIRTGDAVRAILEASAIYQNVTPSFEDTVFGDATRFDPFIDSGCSVLRWWTYAGDAFPGLQDLVRSEGPPALLSVGSSGQVVFRDRGHRFRSSYAVPELVLTSECVGDEENYVALDEESSVDYGWSTVSNVVTGTYEYRTVSGEFTDVWSYTGDVTFGDTSTDGTTYTFEGTVEGGFYDAQDLVGGTLQRIENQGPSQTDVWSGIFPEEHDYVVVSGEVSTYVYYRQGSRVAIQFTDKVLSSGVSTVRDVKLRAKAVEAVDTPVTQRVQGSIDTYGAEKSSEIDLGPVTRADAASIVERVLAKDAYRRPTVVAILRNRSARDMRRMLELDLGQVVTVRANVWAINALFTIEAIEHSLDANGADHTTTLHLQQINPVVTGEGIFTFNDESLGFGTGVFGSAQPADEVTMVLPGTIGSYAYTELETDPGYIDARARISPSVWDNGLYRTIMAQWDDDGDESHAWRFGLDGDGLLRFDVLATTSESNPGFVFDDPEAGFGIGSFNGWPTVLTHTAPAPTPQAPVEFVRAVWQRDTGSGERTVEFFYGSSIDGPWVSVGDVTVEPDIVMETPTGRLTVGSSASGLDDGTGAADEFIGTLGEAQLRDADDNVLVNPVFHEQEIGIVEFDDDAGNTWHLLNGARIAGDGPMFIIGQSPLDSDKLLSY